MSTTPQTNGRTDKSSKRQSKIITLAIPPTILKRFIPRKATSSAASSPAPTPAELPRLKTIASQDNHSDTASTPAMLNDAPSPSSTSAKNPPSVNGVKRSTPLPDGMPKPRGKPGPKKKPRLEDGTIDHSVKPTNATAANHKLGPKANVGAINANLRALDRTGTPCRRWQRRGFQLKSFTGVSWELSSWKGGESSVLTDGASESPTKDVSMHDSSDQKPSETDTAAGSNAGDHHDKMEVSPPGASSPAPMLGHPLSSLPIQA